MTRTELTAAIEAKQAEITAKQAELDNFELDVDDYENSYQEALDSDGPVIIAGMKFDPSYALQELDPTAYRCGLGDYVDSIEKDDDPTYKKLEEELETLEDELSDLESELIDLDD
jgi:predicted  nucleic acid-binding Zn-ribbon protein